MLTKRIWLTAFALIVIGLGGLYFARPYKFVDFSVYYSAGASLLNGRTDLYAPDFALNPAFDYRYPPFFLLIFAPLAMLPQALASYIWYWFSILVMGGSVYLTRKIIDAAQIENAEDKDRSKKTRRLTWILTFFVVAQYFLISLRYGNIHTFIAFLLLGVFYLSMRRQDGWAAGLMSLAVTLKVFPLILLPYFVIKKRWTFLALTILFTILLNLVPAFYFGFERNTALLQNWYQHVVVDREAHEKNTSINLSFKGVLERYLTDINYSQKSIEIDTSARDYPQVNVAAVSEETISRVWLFSAAGIFAGCLALIGLADRFGKNDGKESGRTVLIAYSLMLCLILFVETHTTKIYFVTLLAPAAFLSSVVFGAANRKNIFSRLLLVSAALLSVLLPLLPGRAMQRLLLVLGADFLILCLLMTVAIGLLVRQIQPDELTDRLKSLLKTRRANQPDGTQLTEQIVGVNRKNAVKIYD